MFYPGLHQPSDAGKPPSGFLSVVRLSSRRADLRCPPSWPWILDSGAFSTLQLHGGYPSTPAAYAAHIRRWSACGDLRAAVAQDYMCEPFMLDRTGLSIPRHQVLTLDRYDSLRDCDTAGVYVLPVLQGYAAVDYCRHLAAYGLRIPFGAWVGVGTLCRRNGNPKAVKAILGAILHERPDLQLHGFGLKQTALADPDIRDMLFSADSMAWSYAARREGRNANDWREAIRFAERIEAQAAGRPVVIEPRTNWRDRRAA